MERELEDKYWRQDEGFQAIFEPKNQKTASERGCAVSGAFQGAVGNGLGSWRSLVPPERSQLWAVT